MNNRQRFKGPGTRIYGASDDLIECDGEISGEQGASDDGNMIVASDGTTLEINYGNSGIWRITVLVEGPLFDRLSVNPPDEDDEHGYSDQAFFLPGLKWVMCGRRMR